MLNLVTHEKTNIMQWKARDIGKSLPHNTILRKKKSDQNSSSSEDDDYFVKDETSGGPQLDLNDSGSRFTTALGLMTSQNPIH